MATPNAFTADMLKGMAKLLDDYQPRQSLLMTAGFRRQLTQSDTFKIAPDVNPLFNGYTQSYAGIDIIPANLPLEEVIDWSGCRSPSRAKRRHAKGIPQRIRIEYRERAYLINRNALDKWARDLDARMICAIMGS